MARFASQTKGAITLVCSVVTSIAFGFASRRFDQPSGKWGIFACIGLVAFLVQLALIFSKSKEEAELAEFKRIQSAQNESDAARIENQTRTDNAMTERILLEIKSGNFEEVERWKGLLKDQYGK